MSEKSLHAATRGKDLIIHREEIFQQKDSFAEFNKVLIRGVIEEDFEYSHESWKNKFYKTRVRVKRLSGTEDYVPIVVTDLLLENTFKGTQKGKYVEIGGQFSSYNKLGEDGRKHVQLFLFPTFINVYESKEELLYVANENSIYLEGNICKSPIFRTTQIGKEITELIIAVNTTSRRADYIPCIAWEIYAQYARKLQVGDRVKLYGRIQSRQYFKRFSPDSEAGEYKTAYEVSIMEMMKVED